MEDGLISADFDATPLPEALEAIQRATGVEIVVPVAVESRTLTLTVARASFEQFVRRVLDALELGGFALVYEPNGAAQRVIVVDRARGGVPDTAPSAVPTPPPVTGESA